MSVRNVVNVLPLALAHHKAARVALQAVVLRRDEVRVRARRLLIRILQEGQQRGAIQPARHLVLGASAQVNQRWQNVDALRQVRQ